MGWDISLQGVKDVAYAGVQEMTVFQIVYAGVWEQCGDVSWEKPPLPPRSQLYSSLETD